MLSENAILDCGDTIPPFLSSWHDVCLRRKSSVARHIVGRFFGVDLVALRSIHFLVASTQGSESSWRPDRSMDRLSRPLFRAGTATTGQRREALTRHQEGGHWPQASRTAQASVGGSGQPATAYVLPQASLAHSVKADRTSSSTAADSAGVKCGNRWRIRLGVI